MKLNSYKVQLSRVHEGCRDIFNLPRVNYDALLDTLRFPLLWVNDSYLGGYLPVETEYSLLRWLDELPQDVDLEKLPPARVAQLRRLNLVSSPSRPPLEALRASMDQQGHVKLPQLLPRGWCKAMMPGYYWRNEHLIERWKDLEGVKRTSVNNIPLMRLVHQLVEPLAQKLVADEIKTSYSFISAYETGSTLPAHTDRPQCVYNISLILYAVPDVSLAGWPLFIKHDDVVTGVPLEIGDGVMYSGTRDLHWRDAMPPSLRNVLGVFMHFVLKDFQGTLD